MSKLITDGIVPYSDNEEEPDLENLLTSVDTEAETVKLNNKQDEEAVAKINSTIDKKTRQSKNKAIQTFYFPDNGMLKELKSITVNSGRSSMSNVMAQLLDIFLQAHRALEDEETREVLIRGKVYF